MTEKASLIAEKYLGFTSAGRAFSKILAFELRYQSQEKAGFLYYL